jgi:hypothetical protein
VLLAIVVQPFGILLLALVATGLAGYVVWRIYQSIFDSEQKGTGALGLAQRAGYLGSGIFYGGLAYTAYQILRGIYKAEGNTPQDWTAWLLAQPYGVWLVGLSGVVMMGVALEELWRSYRASFRKDCRVDQMGPVERGAFMCVGRMGIAARALVYGLIGLFLVLAAHRYDPSEAGGLGDALARIAAYSTGPWLLAAVALGLLAYGLYALAEARYRRFKRSQ